MTTTHPTPPQEQSTPVAVASAERRRQRAQEQQRRIARQRRQTRLRVLIALALAGIVLAVLVGTKQIATRQEVAKTAAALDSRPLLAPGALPGLQETPAPWPPEYNALVARYQALQFPPNGDESYHIHALLHIYATGQPVTMPANMGISAAARLESPLHTHDTSGVIHVEAAYPFPFRLADIFAVWGVAFTDHQLGGYTNTAQEQVQVYINGQQITDPTHYVTVIASLPSVRPAQRMVLLRHQFAAEGAHG